MRLPPLSKPRASDTNKAQQQQEGSADAELDRLLAEGKLLEAALYAANQQQHRDATVEPADKPAAGARVVVAVHVDSSCTEELYTATDGDHLQEQQQQPQVNVWQSKCSKLQAWAEKALQQALPDLSLADLHKQLLRQAANSSTSSSSSADRPSLAWWRLPQLSTDADSNRQLATALLQLGSSRAQGWARLAQALSHGLASPAAPAAVASAGLASYRQGRRTSRVQVQHLWLPHSAPKRLSELQTQQAARVKAVLASMPCSATLCVDLSEAGQLLLPRTYLQLVGQKLLARAAVTLPVLLSLPVPPPAWLLRGLFTDPFAQALQLALNEVLSNPDGDASLSIPMLQQPTLQLGDFRRVYPSWDTAAAAAAGSAGGSGSGTGVTGRQPSSFSGEQQARGFLERVGNRALLGVLSSIFRDVQEFEAGLLLASGECSGPCMCQLATVLTKDLQWVLEGCRQQLQELLSSTTEQLFVDTLEEELLQQPLNDLLRSAADVTSDIWPALAVGAAAATAAAVAAPGQQQAATDCTNSAQHTKTTVDSTSSSSDGGSSSRSTQFSIFGSSSLMAFDLKTGTWELTAEPPRFRHTTSGRWHGRGSFTGSFVLQGGSNGRRRSATGSKGAALDAGACSASLRANSITGRGIASSAAGAVAAAGVAEELLVSQPQQVTQGQRQVLLFAGLFLAKRQQFPLLLQDALVAAMVQALLAAVQQMELMFGAPDCSSSLAISSGEETTAHCCCCISTVLCIQRRLLWLQQEWKPQSGTQQQQQQQQQQQETQQQPASEWLSLLDLALEKIAALLKSLHAHLVQQMQDTLRWVVGDAAAAQPWHSHRPPLRRPGSQKHQQQQQQQQQQAHVVGQQQQACTGSGVLASPAVRLWHVLLQAWLHVLRRVLPARVAADILAEVVLHSAQSLVQLYCSLQPSAAWLPVLRQDVAVLVTTAWEFCQPLQVVAQPQLPQHRQLLGAAGSSSGMLQCSGSGRPAGKLRLVQQQQQQKQQQQQFEPVARCSSITEECSAMQPSSTAASLSEGVVFEVSALCKQLVLHSASLSSSSSSGSASADAQLADKSAEQPQQETAAAVLQKPTRADSCTEAAAVDAQDSSWGWLGSGLQLMLESRVLGQGLPARRLIDVTEHAAISTDMDAVEPQAWLQQGRQLLAATNNAGAL